MKAGLRRQLLHRTRGESCPTDTLAAQHSQGFTQLERKHIISRAEERREETQAAGVPVPRNSQAEAAARSPLGWLLWEVFAKHSDFLIYKVRGTRAGC